MGILMANSLERQPLPTVEVGATFVSRRGISPDRTDFDYDTRLRELTPLYLCGLTDPYSLYPTEIDNKRSLLSSILAADRGLTTSPETGEATKYVVCQTFHPDIREMTRGGFLATVRGGVITPVEAQTVDSSYFVEVKGVGHNGGGFIQYTDNFFNTVVLGGLPLRDAWREYDNLRRAYEAGITPLVPLAIGQLLIDKTMQDSCGPLGIVYRLSPSFMRLSYRELAGSLPIETSEDSMAVMAKLIDNFLFKFFQPSEVPIFISPASHLENYLVYDDQKITETDFEDFRELGSNDLPFVHTQTASFIDTKAVIEHYFANFARLDHFDEAEGCLSVANLVQSKLAARGVIIDLSGCTDLCDIAEKLWSEWLIDLDYSARQQQKYAPESMLVFFSSNLDRVAALVATHPARSNEADTQSKLEAKKFGPDEPFDDYRALEDLGREFVIFFEAPELENGQRYEVFLDTNRQIKSMFWKLTNTVGRDNIPDTVYQILNDADNNYEFSARIFGGLSFFEGYINSEIDYVQKLLGKGCVELVPLLNLLRDSKTAINSVMKSNDYRKGVVFFREHLLEHMQAIDHAWKLLS